MSGDRNCAEQFQDTGRQSAGNTGTSGAWKQRRATRHIAGRHRFEHFNEQKEA